MLSGADPSARRCRPAAHALLLINLLLSPNAFADEKPYAPESVTGAVTVSAEQVVELILAKPDLVIIDSRKRSEFSKGHIEGAINLLNTEMQRADLEARVPDKTTPILFYCNGERCLRSSDALHKALEWGYRNLFWFRGGWKEWTDKRLPVISE